MVFGAPGKIVNKSPWDWFEVTQGSGSASIGTVYGYVNTAVASFLSMSGPIGSITPANFNNITVDAIYMVDGVTDSLDIWLNGNRASSVVQEMLGQGLAESDLFAQIFVGYEATPNSSRWARFVNIPSVWNGSGTVWASFRKLE